MKHTPIDPTEPSKPNTNAKLKFFVYGTLKRGFWNYDRFCQGVVAVEEAVIQGRLFETPSGIPVLQVPELHILAHGTTDPLADTATQAHVTASISNPKATVQPDERAMGGHWGSVYGELLTFDDPETRFPAIDRLEGYRPGVPSIYQRVLIPVFTPKQVSAAWIYVGFSNTIGWKHLASGIWPEE